MAAPISEQSKNPTDAQTLQPEQEMEDSPASTDVRPEEGDIAQPSSHTMESEAIQKPDSKIQESGGPSAFHVVSYPDGHKELTTDIPEARDKDQALHLETAGSGSPEAGTGCTGSTENTEQVAAKLVAKHFSAQVVQQEPCGEDSAGGTVAEQDAKVSEHGEGNENEMLSLNAESSRDVGMEGVNIRDIDEAVERALLGVADDDSKYAGESSREMEGLQPKPADIGDSQQERLHEDGELQEAETPHTREKVYNIDEETRMGLDQTPVYDQSSAKPPFTYPSLPPKKLFQIDDTKDSEASDPEAKLSLSMTETEDIRLSHTISIDDATNVSMTSDSNTEAQTPASTRKPFRGHKEGIGISQDTLEGGQRVFTAEHLFEYQWPLDGGEWHLLQEQVSEYLNVKSFKRKYRDLDRRVCDKEEKDFLREKGVVTETQSDLGLTALRSEEVYDLMMKDYNQKYQEYITFLQEKQKKVIREKHKEYSEQAKIDKSKMESYWRKAARSAAEFNASMMREKKDERRAYFDLQTYTIHYPRNKFRTLPAKLTKVGTRPVAVLTGQYQDQYKRYRPEELKYFPVKTVLSDPRKPVKYVRPMPESVRLAIIEKQKPPPPPPPPAPEEKMEVLELPAVVDSVENKENTVVADISVAAEAEPVVPAAVEPQTAEPVTPQVKTEKKSASKSTGKKRPKIELSPERPKKNFKKARESLASAETETPAAEDGAPVDGAEKGKTPDGKNLIPKIHGLEKCRICKQRSTKEERKNEKIVKCAQCGKIGHTSCLDLTEELVAVIKTYPWQCMECKACVKCLDPFDEDKMMFCDRCDRGYHTFCIGLNALPTGHWECGGCEGVPVVVSPRPKPAAAAASASTDEVTTGATSPEPLKTEDGESVPNPEPTPDPTPADGEPVAPSLEAKQEMLEEGEIRIIDNTTVGVPLSHLPLAAPGPKVERRGRKRKYPLDPSKVKPKPVPVAKQERVTGERQSRRLKLREEEEEEKRKKEEEELKLKKKKKKKKLKRLAAEAAAACAAAAAAREAAREAGPEGGETAGGVGIVGEGIVSGGTLGGGTVGAGEPAEGVKDGAAKDVPLPSGQEATTEAEGGEKPGVVSSNEEMEVDQSGDVDTSGGALPDKPDGAEKDMDVPGGDTQPLSAGSAVDSSKPQASSASSQAQTAQLTDTTGTEKKDSTSTAPAPATNVADQAGEKPSDTSKAATVTESSSKAESQPTQPSPTPSEQPQSAPSEQEKIVGTAKPAEVQPTSQKEANSPEEPATTASSTQPDVVQAESQASTDAAETPREDGSGNERELSTPQAADETPLPVSEQQPEPTAEKRDPPSVASLQPPHQPSSEKQEEPSACPQPPHQPAPESREQSSAQIPVACPASEVDSSEHPPSQPAEQSAQEQAKPKEDTASLPPPKESSSSTDVESTPACPPESRLDPPSQTPDPAPSQPATEASLRSPSQTTPTVREDQSAKDLSHTTETPQQTTKTPQQATETPQQTTETPQQTIETPQQTTETPQQTAKTAQQSAKTPQQTAETTQQATETLQKTSETSEKPGGTPEQTAPTPTSAVPPSQPAESSPSTQAPQPTTPAGQESQASSTTTTTTSSSSSSIPTPSSESTLPISADTVSSTPEEESTPVTASAASDAPTPSA